MCVATSNCSDFWKTGCILILITESLNEMKLDLMNLNSFRGIFLTTQFPGSFIIEAGSYEVILIRIQKFDFCLLMRALNIFY